jgi:hypothetical protein
VVMIGASVVDRGSSSFFTVSEVVASGVDSIAVSILGASSATLEVFFSGDFERAKDEKPFVKRRVNVSFLGVSLVSPSSSVTGTSVSGVASVVSPFVREVLTAFSLVFGIKPANILPRFDFSGFAGVSVAVVSSVAGVGSVAVAGVVVSTAAPSMVAGVASTALSSVATGSGVFSLVVVALGLNRFPNPERDLRFSFFSAAPINVNSVKTGGYLSQRQFQQGSQQGFRRLGQFHQL